MDQNALQFIDERQRVLREAYEKYRDQFPQSTGRRNGRLAFSVHEKESIRIPEVSTWAWGCWDDQALDKIITQCLKENDEEYCQLRSNSVKLSRRNWLEDFLNDTGK
jgi:hypothetical protein